MLLFDGLSEDVILERVDDYSLYSYYIGKELEVGKAYTSPLRSDDNIPSFALFKSKDRLLFKDHGLGKSGDIFLFIQLLYGEKRKDVLNRINKDFDLELEGGSEYVKPTKKPKRLNGYKSRPKLLKIRVAPKKKYTKEFLLYWKKYGISAKTLRFYNVSEVDRVEYVYENKRVRYIPKSLCASYRIYNEYKLYEPFSETKFRNNFKEAYVEGYLQLKRKDFCIITKATKEVMFFREHFNWDAVAPKSENTMIKRFMMLRLVKRYEKLFIWFDYDKAGQAAQTKYLKEYPFLIPIYYRKKDKDPTDVYEKSINKKEVLEEIKQLIWQQKKK